jgi:hypothetical protein
LDATGTTLDPEGVVLDEIKPAFTNEANRFCKLAGIAGGTEGAGTEGVGTDTGFEIASCCE